MATILLAIIYVSFISLGLPDSLLGSSWPIMHLDLGADVAYAGVVSLIVSIGTIISSLMSVKVIAKFGTGKTTAVSVLLTALALFMFYASANFMWLCVAAIPLGFGAGAVDSVLNNFVALHYKAKHMNWLHCFWGVGATAGPIIMSLFIAQQSGWRTGYFTIAVIQAILVIILFVSLPLWKKFETSLPKEHKTEIKALNIIQASKIKGAIPAFLTFFCYCAVEATAGLWGSTYMVEAKGLTPSDAAMFVSLFYFGIALGRFLSGFLSFKLSNIQLIRLGCILCLIGILILFLPIPSNLLWIAFGVIGFGSAPIFPAMLHETPVRFGKNVSQSLIGIQMACAYIGITFMPPLFGIIGNSWSMSLFPFFILIIAILMMIFSEKANKHVADIN